MKALELPHLAETAPAQITPPGFPQEQAGNTAYAARCVEPGCYLMGDSFVLNEAFFACRLNGLLVQTHGISVSSFEAGDLSGHQGVFVGEGWWIVVGPLAQLFEVGRQEASPLPLLVDRRRLTS